MRRMALLAVALLCTGIAAYAGEMGKSKDEGKGKAMTGWLCNSKCARENAGKSTCDKSCTATDGDTVFITSEGKVENISNQDMVKSHSGKKVKMMASMNSDTHMLDVYRVEYAGP